MEISLRRSALIMTCAFVVVNTSDSLAAESGRKKKNKPSLEEFIQQVITGGEDTNFGIGVSKLLEIAPGAISKNFSNSPEESSDEQGRSIDVVFDKSIPTSKPLYLVFFAHKPDLLRRETRNFYMSVSTTGVLEKMFFGAVKLDAEGNGIRGSGTHEFQDVNSPRIQKLFKYELEFWLEGKHRKKKPAATAGKGSQPKAESRP